MKGGESMTLYRIKYKGLSDVRSISVEDAKRHGVELSQDLVWDRYGYASDGQIAGINRPKFPTPSSGLVVDGLSEDLLKVLRAEETFTVSEVKEDLSDGEEIITGKPLDDTANVVVDATSGQKSVKGERDPNVDPVPTGPKGSTNRGSSSGGTT
jgi:hypothetical protein